MNGKVLDLSNHDWATFDPACLIAQGYRKAIFGCWNLGITVDMVGRWREADGDASELYCFTYPRLPHELREVANALEVQRQLGGIKVGWPDMESHFTEDPTDLDTEAEGTTVADRIAVLRQALAGLRSSSMETGIYTGRHWWVENMGNTAEFAGQRLWLADYGQNNPGAPRGPIRETSFGGWTTVWRHQYSSAIWACGRNRDHNYEIHEEDDAMTPAEAARMERLERIVAANGIKAAVVKENVDILQAMGITVGVGGTASLVGDRALEYLDRLGASLGGSLNNLNGVVDGHLKAHPGPGAPNADYVRSMERLARILTDAAKTAQQAAQAAQG